ncbi:MAG: GNAT family N-acetyltransferase, partial [bacterium]
VLLSVFRVPGPGRRRVSIAHAPYGGPAPLAATADAVAIAGALPPAELLAGTASLTLRIPDPAPVDLATLAPEERVTLWLELPTDAELLWKGLSAKVRNQVRKAEKAGVTVRTGRRELLDAFYQLYERRQHELGTPAHAKKFLSALLDAFPGAEILVAAQEDGMPVATVFDFAWGAWRVNLYGASDFAQRALCGNMLVYWRSLTRAIETGCRSYDFSRSRADSGTCDFKRQWGAVPRRICDWRARPAAHGAWQVTPAAAESANPQLPRLWRRLPFPVARLLSPWLRPLIP